MSNEENTNYPTKTSIINYVENFIEKRDNELRGSASDDEADARAARGIDRDAIVIGTDGSDFQRENLNNRTSEATTDIDADELNLETDPIVETKEGVANVYKQQVYLRQYQPPTPEPIDIQVQEVIIKPRVQRPPIHVHVGPGQNREQQRTPSPIIIKSGPPPPAPPADEALLYLKYVPVEYQKQPQQIIIHRYPELPPKPRPIVVEQWLPNKPAPKRITYRRVNRDDYVQSEIERQHNRFIEYTKPRTTVEVEIVHLPVIKLTPEEYRNQSMELTRIDRVRSITQDPNTLLWRI